MGTKRTLLGTESSLVWSKPWTDLLPSKRVKKAAKREKKGSMYRGKAGRESGVDGGQKRCKWLGVNGGVINGRGETSAYGGKGGVRRREPKGEQRGERNAGKKQKRRARMNLLSVLCPKRDSNPHSRKGQGILSPSCLPFHHQGEPWFLENRRKDSAFLQ